MAQRNSERNADADMRGQSFDAKYKMLGLVKLRVDGDTDANGKFDTAGQSGVQVTSYIC